MPRSRPKRQRHEEGNASAETQAALADFVRLMGQIQPSEAGSRLQLDMARDAGLEVCRQLLAKIERVRARLSRARQRRRESQERIGVLLNGLATGPVVLPRPPGVGPLDPIQVLAPYHDLVGDDFPALARTLHDAGGRIDILSYRSFLVEEVFAKGNAILVEHLVRRVARGQQADEERFLDELRNHLAGQVNRALARQTGYQVTPEVGKQLDNLLVKSLRFLLDLLRCQPPARLILPPNGSPFDPQRHEPIPGRPTTGKLIVRATLSPGYVVLEEPPRLLAKAQVYTKRVKEGKEDLTQSRKEDNRGAE